MTMRRRIAALEAGAAGADHCPRCGGLAAIPYLQVLGPAVERGGPLPDVPACRCGGSRSYIAALERFGRADDAPAPDCQ